jgi:GT2 family glycosyltransferase
MTGVGLVVPTLGRRPVSLKKTIESALGCSRITSIVIVCPAQSILELSEIYSDPRISFVSDPKKGLATAINLGFATFKTEKYWNWCADDDYLLSNNYDRFAQAAEETNSLWAIGECRINYASLNWNLLARPTKLMWFLHRYGPNLVPQVSCLFSVQFTKNIGGIDEKFALAFDQLLISRFLNVSEPFIFPSQTAVYVWHQETLSNTNRLSSQRESIGIRIHLASNSRKKMLVFLLVLPSFGFIILSHLLFKLLNSTRRLG